MQKVDGQVINGVCGCRTSQLSGTSAVILIAFVLGENSPSVLVDFVRGPFHVPDTVYWIQDSKLAGGVRALRNINK